MIKILIFLSKKFNFIDSFLKRLIGDYKNISPAIEQKKSLDEICQDELILIEEGKKKVRTYHRPV